MNCLLFSVTASHPLGVGLAMVCLLMAAVVAIKYRRSGIAVSALMLACASVCMIAAKVRLVSPGDVAPVVFIVDISPSHRPLLGGGRWQQLQGQIAAMAASSDVPSVVAFVDSEPRLVIKADAGKQPEFPRDLPVARDGYASYPESAASIDGVSRARRVMLVSDGASDLEALRRGFPEAVVYAARLGDVIPDAVRMLGVELPPETVRDLPVIARVTHGGVSAGSRVITVMDPLVLTAAPVVLAEVPGGPGTTVTPVTLPAGLFAADGPRELRFAVSALEGADLWPENNSVTAVTVVGSRRPVLYASLSAEPGRDPLFRLLSGSGMDLVPVSPAALGAGNPALLTAGGMVLNDVPAGELPERGEAVRRASGLLGIPLLVVGAANAFGPGGYDGSPLELALPLDANPDPGKPRHHVLLLDVSASMAERIEGRERIAVLREAVIASCTGMDQEDKVGVIPFSGTVKEGAGKFIAMDAEGKAALASALAAMSAGGATSIPNAIRAAADALEAVPGLAESEMKDSGSSHRPRVLLVTDGESRDADTSGFAGDVRRLAATGAELRIVLLADGDEPDWLEQLRSTAHGLVTGVIRTPDLSRLGDTLAGIQSEHARSLHDPSEFEAKWLPLPDAGDNTPESSLSLAGRTRVAPKPVGDPVPLLVTTTGDTVGAWWVSGRGAVAAIAVDCHGHPEPGNLGKPGFPEGLVRVARWLATHTPVQQFTATVRHSEAGQSIHLRTVGEEPLPQGTVVTALLQPVAGPATSNPMEFTRATPFEWRGMMPAALAGTSLILIPSVEGIGGDASATPPPAAIPVALPVPGELLPPVDAPRRLRNFVVSTGGQMLDDSVLAFPDRLAPIESEERRITWALVVLMLGCIGFAIWYRRRV